MTHYDVIIVGAGLYGAVIAEQAVRCGQSVLVLEKRDYVAGYCHSYRDADTGLVVHRHGAHIFHTNNKAVWDYVTRFATFIPYVHRVRARVDGVTYPLPINLDTLRRFFGVPLEGDDVERFVASQRGSIREPSNFEEKAINLVGPGIYEGFVRHYTAKQWGIDPSHLPANMRLRVDFRPTDDDWYFDDRYQGVPAAGYTSMIERMLSGAHVELGVDFCEDPDRWRRMARTIVYTGPLDRYFSYRHGPLKWREFSHDMRHEDAASRLEAPVININDASSPHSRIADYSQIGNTGCPLGSRIVLGWESLKDVDDNPRAYAENKVLKPVRLEEEDERMKRYECDARGEPNVHFGGRMADYRLYDMEHVVALALKAARSVITRH